MIKYVISHALLLSILFYYVDSFNKLSESYDSVYADNVRLADQVKLQDTTVDKLMANGWSRNKAQDFVNQGCLMYLDVM